jgi:hypothetical protein
MKSHLRFRRASGSTRRLIERIVQRGERVTRRALTSSKRRELYNHERVGIYV